MTSLNQRREIKPDLTARYRIAQGFIAGGDGPCMSIRGKTINRKIVLHGLDHFGCRGHIGEHVGQGGGFANLNLACTLPIEACNKLCVAAVLGPEWYVYHSGPRTAIFVRTLHLS